ncbi:MAG: hypothetical protein JWO91_850 [Acidobacteriaceae bacterium]|jgi:hypothetical protein|nr:hypothetical protein [Acidobacteriaceae bacterium]
MATDSANTEQAPNPNEKLARVFDTEQESEAMIVRGLLESDGIDAEVIALDATQDVLPGVGGTVVLVREEDANRARKLIRESLRSDEDTAEMDAISDPQSEG